MTPLKNKAATDIQKTEEIPKTIIQIPKTKIAANSFFPAFLLIGIYAVTSIVKKEPIEGADTKIPKPCGPTFKISSAKTASKAIAQPNKTENMSKVSAPKIALVLNTKRTPSFRLCKTGSPILGFKTGFLFILNNIKKEKVTRKKMTLKDQ